MPALLDLNLLPIQRKAGQDQSDFPGLYAATPPHRAARGRDQDNLVLYLSLLGGLPVPAEQQVQTLTRLAQTFYKTPGAVTSALRMLVDTLNRSLLESNLHHPGNQATGLLTLIVIRGDSVTLAHSGPGHAAVLTPLETQDYADEQGSGSGIGLSRTPVQRFFQFSLHPNEFVLLTHQPIDDWQVDELRISPNQGMEGLRRRLLIGRGEADLNAVLIQALSGVGKLRFLRVKTHLPEMAHPQTAASAQQNPPPETQAVPEQQAEPPKQAEAEQQPVADPQTAPEPSPASDSPPASEPPPVIDHRPASEIQETLEDRAALVAQAVSEAQAPPPEGAAAPINWIAQVVEPVSGAAPVVESEGESTAPPEQDEKPAPLDVPVPEREMPAPAPQVVPQVKPPEAVKTRAAPANQAVFTSLAAPASRAQATKVQDKPKSQPERQAASTRQRTVRVRSSVASPRRLAITGGLKKAASAVVKFIAAFLNAVSNVLRKAGSALLVFVRRVLPDENMLNISPRTLLFIAIAVPILVSVVGGMVYLERGQAAQYQQYYDQAAQASTQAVAKTDPVEKRLAWQSTLELLDKAEFYRLTPESEALREVARASLDELDGIERLDYQPALIGTLDKSINITRLVTVGGDLYMLNGSQGNVIRAVLTGGGYQIDPQFICGPIAGGVAVVGPLMDISALPRGDDNGATIMGIDASGTSILCIPGEPPLLQPVTPPGVNFSEIRSMEVNLGDLYLLDPGLSAVWIYRGLETALPPRLFFGEEVPGVLDVVDMMVDNDDLYLLHADGHVTLCAYEYNLQETMTRCEDTLNYVDLRQGRNGGPVIPDALFSQIQFAPPPDPSLYMLDPKSQAIYHFSLRLAFQRQFLPFKALSTNPATAFVISTSRMAFLAVGNRVYYASLP